MENSKNSLPVSAHALLELQLSDWQAVASQQTEDTDPAEVSFANRQIGRIKIELAAESPVPAFDTHVRTPTHPDEAAFVVPEHEAGLSKREYFAAKAMNGLLAHGGAHNAPYMAKQAVEHADALIEALNK